jgi:hypothetical protein
MVDTRFSLFHHSFQLALPIPSSARRGRMREGPARPQRANPTTRAVFADVAMGYGSLGKVQMVILLALSSTAAKRTKSSFIRATASPKDPPWAGSTDN